MPDEENGMPDEENGQMKKMARRYLKLFFSNDLIFFYS